MLFKLKTFMLDFECETARDAKYLCKRMKEMYPHVCKHFKMIQCEDFYRFEYDVMIPRLCEKWFERNLLEYLENITKDAMRICNIELDKMELA